MSPCTIHRLADDRHAARYRSPRHRPDAPRQPRPARERLGLLLVEAGLYLVTTADRPRRAMRLAA